MVGRYEMTSSAIVMFIVSCTLVWGGLVASVVVMNKRKAPWQLEDESAMVQE